MIPQSKKDFDFDFSFSMTTDQLVIPVTAWRDYASYTLMIWKLQQHKVILELNSQVLSYVKLILPAVA